MSDCSINAFKVPEGMCSCNRSRGYDELLQRNQLLGQVAKEMLICVRKWNPSMALVYEDNLEALGVILDG